MPSAVVKKAKSIPEQLREMDGYLNSTQVMKLLDMKKTAFYAHVRSGEIPVTRLGKGLLIDPIELADRLERVST